VGCGPCSDEMPYLSHSKKAAVVAEADTGGRFDLVLVCPRPVARRVAPFGGWGRKWRLANAGVAEGSSGAVAALVLGGRRRPAVYRGGRIDGVRGGAGAVEALRDVVLVVDGRNHGGGAGRDAKLWPEGRLSKALAELAVVPTTWRRARLTSARVGFVGERSGLCLRKGDGDGFSLMPAPSVGLIIRELLGVSDIASSKKVVEEMRDSSQTSQDVMATACPWE
jgi:hypothetical protein